MIIGDSKHPFINYSKYPKGCVVQCKNSDEIGHVLSFIRQGTTVNLRVEWADGETFNISPLDVFV